MFSKYFCTLFGKKWQWNARNMILLSACTLDGSFISFICVKRSIETKLWCWFAFALSCGTGDLGQTYDSVTTLQHYLQSSGQCLLYVGDLSYADTYPFDYQVRWDTWSRLIEGSAAYQPWIWTSGNHDIEFYLKWYVVQIWEIKLLLCQTKPPPKKIRI